MKKKIVFVTTALWIGGIETALANLLKQFDYDSYELTLVVLKAEMDLLPRIDPRCRVLILDRDRTVSFTKPYRHSKLYHLTEESSAPSRLHRLMRWAVPVIKRIETYFYLSYIRSCLRNESFDTAVIYSDAVAGFTVKAVRANRYLMFYHHGIMRRIDYDSAAWRRCRHIVAVSRHQAEQLRLFRPRYAEKITVIHNLADIETVTSRAEADPPQTFRHDCFHIVTVGRVSWEKGMDLAAEACALLVRAGFTKLRWWIVGGGPALRELHDQIHRLEIEAYMIPVGMAENPYPYIRKANLYVQPSRFEGYPMTLLEALVLGKPVLSTDNPGARELLQSYGTGHMCKIDAGDMADQIRNLMTAGGNAELYCQSPPLSALRDENRRCLEQLYALL